jgi:hypothetical protein
MSSKKIKVNFRDHMSLRLPDDEYQDHSYEFDSKCDFKLYTMDLSYFAGKLEMYFRYKELSFERIEGTSRDHNDILFPHTRSEQVPQVYDRRKTTKDSHRWLRDTTPIIEHLEKDPLIIEKSRPVIPSCTVQAFFQRLIEDYADEFLWRPAMFWRWEPEFDREVMGIRFTYECLREAPKRYFYPSWSVRYAMSFRQWFLSCFGEDCVTQAKKDLIKHQYYELLDILEEILSKRPYLFGNHPTLVDFGFMGPFFRHFSSDFTPRKVMQIRAPNVYEWIARLWNCKGSKLNDDNGFPESGNIPEYWSKLMSLLSEYLEYYYLNALAYQEGKEVFVWIYRNETFTVPVVHYRVWCRLQLQLHYENITDEFAKDTIKNLLIKYNCWEWFWKGGKIYAPPEGGIEPPLCIPPRHEHDYASIILYKWPWVPVFKRYVKYIYRKTVHPLAMTVSLGYALILFFYSKK